MIQSGENPSPFLILYPHRNMFTIVYETPYPSAGLNEEWRTQQFYTEEEAISMINFYRSCGVRANLMESIDGNR